MTNLTRERGVDRVHQTFYLSQMPILRRELQNIPDYVPGKSIDEIKEKYGLRSVVKLASNENPLGTSPLAVKAFEACAKKLHLYPRGDAPELVNALAKKLKVKPQNIIIGNGSDEILDLAARAYLQKNDIAAGAKETFSVYKSATVSAGARYEEVPLEKGGVYPIAKLAEQKKAKIIFICNPNNPTGTYLSEREIEKFLGVVSSETLIILDQAYTEFSTAPLANNSTLARIIKKFPNLLITRTFSKLYGLAGLRVGYGIAGEQIIRDLKKIKLPFNSNYPAQMAAAAAIGDEAFVKKSLEMNAKERENLTANFQKMGFEVLPSQANFICVKIGNRAFELIEFLEKNGVVIRGLKNFGMPEWVRITVGTPSQNKKATHLCTAFLSNTD